MSKGYRRITNAMRDAHDERFTVPAADVLAQATLPLSEGMQRLVDADFAAIEARYFAALASIDPEIQQRLLSGDFKPARVFITSNPVRRDDWVWSRDTYAQYEARFNAHVNAEPQRQTQSFEDRVSFERLNRLRSYRNA